MKKMRKFLCMLLSVAMLLALCACGSSPDAKLSKAYDKYLSQFKAGGANGTLTVALSPDFAPMEFYDVAKSGDAAIVGFDVLLANYLAQELDMKLVLKPMSFDACQAAVQTGNADIGISGFSVDPERAKEIDFSSSYYIDDQAVAVMNSSTITDANADAELNKEGVIIAVQSGTTGEAYVQENYPKATAQAYGNSTDAFAAMQSGQANAVCTNKAVVEAMLADAYKDAKVVKSIATGEEYAIVVSKDNTALTAAINDALAKLKADGTIEKLTNQFM